ncbi:SusC/RagA family TonB-linked outer membrane protein [Prevotella sp. lc2012]|uniref:SusC/RagA family TonB-linked outer membrane protein n=1 Tax=Prevotella sp. lc2012 TaxID=1761886 RepID=UPI0008988112|nr:SusC/RagA family TonB-linked outer membrane protein [Prevotella sp. lc2012]SEE50450.1 TonB-linked outer membrane protein, SusC/RagA family [Prevotella sp. lc2012]
MKERLTMFLVGFFLCAGSMLAQTKVSGTVLSQEDGQPIIGAAVKVDGTSTGMLTDVNGRFSLTLPEGKNQLTISYLGYQSKTVAAKNGMRVFLASDSQVLQDVVVTAMGIKRSAKALGYSATAVDGDKIAAARTADIMSSLQGKVAGVQISSSASDPGSSNSVIIRGISSLSGTNQPLYVIDGVPMNNSAVYSTDGLNSGYDFGNGANAVNPDDVENMTILKGAAATALYGSRAANGVILITTKSGKKQEKGLGIEYNGGLQWEQVMRLPQMQNEFGMGWNGDKTDDENGSWGPRFDGSTLKYGTVYNNSQQIKSYLPIENNMEDFFDTGFRYSNSLSFNGATDKSDYFVSFSQIKDDGIIPTDADSYQKYTFSARGTHKVKALTFSSSLNYAYQKNNFVQTGQGFENMYNSIMQTPRDIAIVELKDLDNPFNTPGYYYTPYSVMNPYYILNNHLNENESERFYGKFQMDYDFLKWFKLTYRVGLDTSTAHHHIGIPNYESLFPNTPNWESEFHNKQTGKTSRKTTRRREINQDVMLTFDMPINDFNINAVVGFNGNERQYSHMFTETTNLTIPTYYNITNSAGIPTVEEYQWKRRLYGVYAQAEVAWKNQLYLTLTARNDWSSTLPKENRSFFYPGVTVSYLFSELLKEKTPWLSFGKLRLAWGKTGNDASVYMTDPYYIQGNFDSSGWAESKFPFTKTSTNAYTVGNVLGSNTLSPEMTTETEVGVQLAFFKNRISVDATYYNRNSDKQITRLSTDAASGYTAQNVNLGKIRNRGVELLVTVVPVRTKDFEWSLTWNYTKNNNKVIKLPEEMNGRASIYGFSGGTGLYAIEGDEMGVFEAYVAKTNGEGKIIVDKNGLPQNSDKLVKIGSINYDYMMGIGNSLRYKDFTLSFDFDIRQGGLMFSRTQDITYFTGNAMQTTYNDRNPFIVPNSVIDNGDGTYSENTIALYGTTLYNYWDNGAAAMGSASLISKSYVKLRQVVFGWNVPSKWLAKTPLTGVRFSIFGNNLLMWTPSSNTFIDPEASSFGNDLEGNFGEYSSNPSSRKFGFNVNVKF